LNRALFAGLSGTINNQTRLDVIGNNLANASTIGFKSSRVTFRDAYYQTLRGGHASSEDGIGGVNPLQVGSGNALSAIQTLHTQGSLEATGQPLDVAIEGSGMFIVRAGDVRLFTRDGAFTLDDANTLVSGHSGMRVQGWMATDGSIDASGAIGDLQFDVGKLKPGVVTTSVTMAGNLKANAAVGDDVVSSIQVYDSLSNSHELVITMTQTATDNEYDVTLECEGSSGTGTLTFDANGALTGGSPITVSFDPGGGADSPQIVSVDFSDVTQLALDSDAAAMRQDGRSAASLANVYVQEGGVIQGTYSDGRQVNLGQLALASFANVAGMQRRGNNLYAATAAAGDTIIGTSSSGSRGKIVPQALEQSNVDLTQAFVDMISTQRAFQASTRVISSADKLLEEVMRLARS